MTDFTSRARIKERRKKRRFIFFSHGFLFKNKKNLLRWLWQSRLAQLRVRASEFYDNSSPSILHLQVPCPPFSAIGFLLPTVLQFTRYPPRAPSISGGWQYLTSEDLGPALKCAWSSSSPYLHKSCVFEVLKVFCCCCFGFYFLGLCGLWVCAFWSLWTLLEFFTRFLEAAFQL